MSELIRSGPFGPFGLTVICIGLIILIALICFAAYQIILMTYGILSGWREHRAAEARRLTVEIPGLGSFTSTDDELWEGTVGDLEVTFTCPGRAPDAREAGAYATAMARLPALETAARQRLVELVDLSRLAGGVASLHLWGIDLSAQGLKEIYFQHPDDYGMFRVEFRGDVIIDCDYAD